MLNLESLTPATAASLSHARQWEVDTDVPAGGAISYASSMLTLLVLIAALQPLSNFVGDWKCTERQANGQTNQARMQVQPSFDGAWLEIQFEQLGVDKPVRGVEYWGWDGKRFVALGLNNQGARESGASDGWKGAELGDGRVAQPFGFALTDPSMRLSRTRLFTRVTRGVECLGFEAW